MSEAKFTKGKWFLIYGDQGGNKTKITTTARVDTCTVSICNIDAYFNGPVGVEQKANAHLMVAAPEMYELLDEVSHVLGHELNPTSKTYIKAIKKLLAKARGEHD